MVLLDCRGEGVYASQEFDQYHITGAVNFPYGWVNRQNHLTALMRFRNVPSKIVIVYRENERQGAAIAKVIAEKGFTNVYLLTGGLSQWALHHRDLI